jgi:hypothetical protein
VDGQTPDKHGQPREIRSAAVIAHVAIRTPSRNARKAMAGKRCVPCAVGGNASSGILQRQIGLYRRLQGPSI